MEPMLNSVGRRASVDVHRTRDENPWRGVTDYLFITITNVDTVADRFSLFLSRRPFFVFVIASSGTVNDFQCQRPASRVCARTRCVCARGYLAGAWRMINICPVNEWEADYPKKRKTRNFTST